jgi:outer membrane immunogenic protein
VDINGYDVLQRGGRGWSYTVDSSVLGGGTAGCNWQPAGSPFVLGIEGEAGYLHLPGAAPDPLATNVVSTAKIGDWYSMATGRLGYAVDRALFYVKGGAAFVNTQASISDPAPGIRGLGPISATVSNTNATWTAGGGIEWAFNANWSLKAEYMYLGLNKTLTDCAALGGTSYCWSNFGNSSGISTAKVGFNYRFGAPAVVARY